MIAYLSGIAVHIGRGRFILSLEDHASIGYEVRYGAGLDPVIGQPITCWIVHSFPQSGPQVLYGYVSGLDREMAELMTDADGVGPGSAHKIIHALGGPQLRAMAKAGGLLGSAKVAGVSKAKVEAAIQAYAKGCSDGRSVSNYKPEYLKVTTALEAMGLDPKDYKDAISDLMADDDASKTMTTSQLLNAVLKKGTS